MHKMRFPNIFILLNVLYYTLQITIIIALPIKAVAFSKAKLMNFFTWIFYFRLKIYYFIGEGMKKTLPKQKHWINFTFEIS